MLTFTRSSGILGIIHTLFLLRLSRTGASILPSCVLSKIGRLGGTSDVLLAETFGPCDCWSCGSLVRTFLLPSLRDAYGGLLPCSIFSFLPPSTTLRKYQRTTLATATGELGAIYCSIVSFANTGEHTSQDVQEIVQSLIAIRAKLKRSLVLKQNVIFEVRS